MARKIKFPLEMDNEIMVRSLEELKDNFSLERVISYFVSGKLLNWLNDRYYEDEAKQVAELNPSTPDLKQLICEIFEIKYTKETEIDIEALEQKNIKIAKLKQFTEDESIIKNFDSVAFNQEELAYLLDENITPIYLCGDKFTIPLIKENITYLGVNNPTAVIKSNTLVDFSMKSIELKNVRYNEEYQELIDDSEEKDNDTNKSFEGSYKTSPLLDFMMKSKSRESSSKLFNIICSELSGVNYDIDKNIKDKVDIINQANLNEVFDKYLSEISWFKNTFRK